ncbi:MAG TPA: phosphotransferase, partial [Gemmatimonadaceae bacterium]
MPALTHPLPEVSVADAEEILLTHWKLRGQVRVLPGERERNFHVYTGEGREFVLKVASPLESLAVIELQVEALSHIATTRADLPVPRIVPATDGSRLVSHPVKGEDHSARLLTWLPGRPLAEVSPHAPDLLREIGRSLGALTAALATFQHPAARRDLKWDLGAAGWIAGHVARLEEDGPRHRVERILDEYTSRLVPELARTRASVVHNDANDYNVLVTGTSDGGLALSGIIDYGDLLYSHPVCDLAIAIAYVMMGKPDPLSAATPLVAGYHESFPMSERELGLLFPLARTRLAVSVVNAALQAKAEPGNAYLQVSADGAARLLEQLDTVHPRLAEYRFRDACGLEPCPGSAAVARWLDANREHVAPLSGSPFGPGDVHVHDFSVTSGTIGSIEQWSDQRRFTQLVNEELASVGARVGIGRYDEVRALYTTDLFRVEGNDGPEWRTVHLGIDVGAAPGAAIHAPIDGIVHSLRDNDAAGDYGPTVILEHAATHERPVFWTLYGHLNRETLTRVQPGQSIRAGDAIGWLGDVSVNGGWWPHVHVQVICDLFDRSGDFQGVARPVERTVMLSVSPDPSPLLGLDASGRASRAADVSELRQRRT